MNTAQRKHITRMNRIRRVRLEEWEATAPNLCWLTIWEAYREKEVVNELPMPQLSQEWDDLRKWAKQYIKRHSHTSRSNPYFTLPAIHADHISDVVHILDNPSNTNAKWPHDSPRPIELPDRAAAIMVLVKRLPTIASIL